MSEESKKEKVLHTRISETLDKQIKRNASSLGISVSNLVRNILLNTFGLVEDLVADSARISKSIAKSASGDSFVDSSGRSRSIDDGSSASRQGKPPEILGWQEVILNLNAICAYCNAILPKGAQAAIAVVEGTESRPIICPGCLKEVTHESTSQTTES